MSLTLADAITQTRYALNEASASFWTDAELTAWIQEAVRSFSSKTLMVETTDTLDPLVANQLSYTSSDETWIDEMLEIYAAIYNDGSNKHKGLIKVHPRMLGNVATFTSGAPKYYCMHARALYIWPLASAAVAAAGSIEFLYATETDDITVMTDEFQHLPILYATAKAKQKDRKFGESATLMQQFLQEISFERADKHAREVDSLDKFKVPNRGGGTESKAG